MIIYNKTKFEVRNHYFEDNVFGLDTKTHRYETTGDHKWQRGRYVMAHMR